MLFRSDGADGMPAHVTLIYPFVDAEHLGAAHVDGLRATLDAFAPFEVTFARFARFDARPPVLYLEPDPPQPFRDMVAAIARDFPAYPPFGGVHETVIPHLTIAQTDDGAARRAAEDDIGRHLPIRARVVEVAVMEHRADGWRTRERISLEPV